jgi:hypothetical protein
MRAARPRQGEIQLEDVPDHPDIRPGAPGPQAEALQQVEVEPSTQEDGPIEAGKDYEFSLTYDNPRKEAIPAMGTLHFFIHSNPRG